MNFKSFTALPGQQGTALGKVAALLQSAPSTAGDNLFQPVECVVGAVVKRGPQGDYLHAPHCSALIDLSPVWKYRRGRTGQMSYRFEQDQLPFLDVPEGEVGLLHYFGLFGVNPEGGMVVKPLAVEWLATPGADADGFEYQGGAEWAAEQHCQQFGLGDFNDRYRGHVRQLMADRAVVLQQPSRFRVRVNGSQRTLCDFGIPSRFFSAPARRERACAAGKGQLLTMAECN